MKRLSMALAALLLILAPAFAGQAPAQEASEEELAKQLANPVADLISVPFQMNYDTDIGPADDGSRFTLNFQPVIPFELNDKWTVITRTIVPIISQDDIYPGAGSQTGISDIVETVFFSPRPGPSGLVWGVGPVLLLPTATDDLLGTKKWGAGPSVVLLKQTGGWTYGGLANHIESFAGDSDRSDISATFVNPFLSRQLPGGWSIGTQLEHTFEHENGQDSGQWAAFISKVTRIGNQNVSFTLVPRYWYETSAGSPEGFGIRVAVVLIFPR